MFLEKERAAFDVYDKLVEQFATQDFDNDKPKRRSESGSRSVESEERRALNESSASTSTRGNFCAHNTGFIEGE